MKKLMFAMGVAALCGAVHAIESANVVGYKSKESPKGKFMIGTVPFETCGGTLNLNELLSGFTPVEIDWDDPTAFWSTAAQIQIWNGSSYDNAFYVSNAYFDDGSEEGLEVEGWCDDQGVLYKNDGIANGGRDYEFTPGGAYWIKNVPDSKPLNVAGAVKGADSVSFNCPKGQFMLAGNAFPVDINLNDTQMTSVDITPVAIDWDNPTAFWDTATQLQIWNGTSYDNAFYVSNAYFDDGSEEGLEIQGWCDDQGVLYKNDGIENGGRDFIIPAGNGFWVKATSGECNLIFNNPLK